MDRWNVPLNSTPPSVAAITCARFISRTLYKFLTTVGTRQSLSFKMIVLIFGKLITYAYRSLIFNILQLRDELQISISTKWFARFYAYSLYAESNYKFIARTWLLSCSAQLGNIIIASMIGSGAAITVIRCRRRRHRLTIITLKSSGISSWIKLPQPDCSTRYSCRTQVEKHVSSICTRTSCGTFVLQFADMSTAYCV